jgi:hypothetical protein
VINSVPLFKGGALFFASFLSPPSSFCSLPSPPPSFSARLHPSYGILLLSLLLAASPLLISVDYGIGYDHSLVYWLTNSGTANRPISACVFLTSKQCLQPRNRRTAYDEPEFFFVASSVRIRIYLCRCRVPYSALTRNLSCIPDVQYIPKGRAHQPYRPVHAQ